MCWWVYSTSRLKHGSCLIEPKQRDISIIPHGPGTRDAIAVQGVGHLGHLDGWLHLAKWSILLKPPAIAAFTIHHLLNAGAAVMIQGCGGDPILPIAHCTFPIPRPRLVRHVADTPIHSTRLIPLARPARLVSVDGFEFQAVQRLCSSRLASLPSS